MTEKKKSGFQIDADVLREVERQTRLGYWKHDIQKNELFWSDGPYRIFEVDPEEFGANYDYFLQLVHPEDRKKVDKAYSTSLEKKTGYEIVHRLKFADGRIKYVVETCTTSFDKDGKPLVSIGSTQDITEKVLLEEEKKLLTRKVLASSKMSNMGQMAASVCHEINNPLMQVSCAIDNLHARLEQKTNLDEEEKELFHEIGHSFERIGDVVSGLQSYMYPGKADKKLINLRVLFKKKFTYLIPLFKRNGVVINYDISNEKLTVMANETELHQILVNALTNSQHATTHKNDPRVDIHIFREGQNVVVSICDNGDGVTPEISARAFEEYFTTKDIGQGTGIGLKITRDIVESLGGNVSLEDRKEGGAELRIVIPFTPKANNEETPPDPFILPRGNKLAGKKLLVVDDEPALAEGIKFYCETLGMKVIISINGKEALEQIKNNSFDFILTDQHLGQMSGRQLIDQAKKIVSNDPKIILMTGLPNFEDYSMGVPIMEKPFSLKNLGILLSS